MEKNTDKAQVYNLIILDKSGSMSSIEKAAIAGFNETVGGIRSAQRQFAATQQHYISLLTFCSCTMEYVYDCVAVDAVSNLTARDYQPCCGTPLYDAMGKGINDMLKRIKSVEGASVVVTIITDGMENSSHEYSGKAVKALVDKMRDEYGWNFAYIGTNQDVEAVAVSLSITNTMFFEDTAEGMSHAWERERKSKHRMFSRIDKVYAEAAPTSSAGTRTSLLRDMMRKNVNYKEMKDYKHRVTPEKVEHMKEGQVFVFGSDPEGRHEGGAAHVALTHFGAVKGQGEGLQGQSYAIPSTMGIDEMAKHVRDFIAFAERNPQLTFLVTPIGCGHGRQVPSSVAPLFVGAVDVENIWLPQVFWNELV